MTTTAVPARWSPQTHPYPAARRSDAATTYKSAKHGEVRVPEPYDWLEKPPSESAETRTWTEAQAAYTQNFLEACSDTATLRERLEKNWDYARCSAPSRKRDGRYYYSYNSGLAPQSQLYRATREQLDEAQQRGEQGPVGELFFDTNVLSSDGTVALTTTAFSHTGRYFAYGLSQSGSDWYKVYFRSTEAPLTEGGEPGGKGRLDDVLEHIKFSSIAWTHDDKGVFYQRYPEPSSADLGTDTDANKDAQLYYHRLGTPQSEDVLVIDKDTATPSSIWQAEVTDDGKWLLVENAKDTDVKQRFFLANLEDQPIGPEMRWIPLSSEFKYTLGYLGNDGTRFYFITNESAPNYRVVAADVRPEQAQRASHVAELQGRVPLVDVVPEDRDALLASAVVVAERQLLLVYSRDVKDEVWLHDLPTGERVRRLLPELVGSVSQIAGRREELEAFIATTSFTNPGQIERLTWRPEATQHAEPPSEVRTYRTTHVAGIRASDYVSTQVFFHSRDGTRVPMFLTYPKDMPLDGSAPALVYFYGGFNIPLTPMFSPSMMTWVASYRGVLAFVNARGGGEYGDPWHEAGCLFNKQNVFDDVLAACEYLHTERYAAKGKLIINGGSNGGLGVAAVTNQATPAAGIGAAIADVGVHDMLKFAQWTIGSAWCADYGNPAEDPKAFDYNYAYSPLHNVDEQKEYPTVVLACADHDDRVVPAHSFKLAAELQHRRAQNANPLLLRVELQAGHGAGKSTQKRIAEASESTSCVHGTWLTSRVRNCGAHAWAQAACAAGQRQPVGRRPSIGKAAHSASRGYPCVPLRGSPWRRASRGRRPGSAHCRCRRPCPSCGSPPWTAAARPPPPRCPCPGTGSRPRRPYRARARPARGSAAARPPR